MNWIPLCMTDLNYDIRRTRYRLHPEWYCVQDFHNDDDIRLLTISASSRVTAGYRSGNLDEGMPVGGAGSSLLWEDRQLLT